MGAIRGAICAENTIEDISAKSVELVKEIFARNGLVTEQVEAIIFSSTDDLDACYPAKSVRETLNLPNVAFMCLAEMKVQHSLTHCIRVCVLVEGLAQSSCKHCYLGEASVLRADLKED